MVATVFIVIIGLVALISLIIAIASRDFGVLAVTLVAGIFGLVVTGFSTIYQQDVGESIMIRSTTGSITGISTEAGWHMKKPWEKAISFDTRNNVVSFINAKSESGKDATGTYITIQDRDGAKANIDIVVRYSLDPSKIETIYKNFKTQENFTERVLVQAVRSTVREVPTAYGTMEVLNKRAEIGSKIAEDLRTQLEPHGVILEDVDLQEIAYSSEVQDRLDEAQTSRIAVDKAKADLDRAKIEAETAKTSAQGTADANKILEGSLTEKILQQKYIDALAKAGTVYVVPEGSTPLITTK